MNAIRQVFGITTRAVPLVRPMSATAGPLVDLSVDNEGIAILTIQKPPVNSFNLELVQELNKSMDEVSKSKAKGMILTSALPTVFSGGIDINEMYRPEFERLGLFWDNLQDFWLKLFGSEFITAAAINGHAPAGGCQFAMSCEYRVMVSGKFTIGLNETALGIEPTSWFVDTMRHTLPARQAELALTRGTMFTVDEALKVGLIDEIASDKADAIEKSKLFIRKFDKISPSARALTKRSIRDGPMRRLLENRQANKDHMMSSLKDEAVQQSLQVYMNNLKKKSAKKAK